MSKLKSLENAMHSAVLSLGANTGDPQRQLDEALRAIDQFASVDTVSSLYETAPVGNVSQPEFLNVAALVRTHLDLMTFHPALRKIEVDLGRIQTVRNGPRPIDIDIVFFDDCIVDRPGLTVPHPRYADRNFVLYPLYEIVPDWICPVRHQPVSVILRTCRDTAAVRRLASVWREGTPA